MKLLLCIACTDIRTIELEKWTTCKCKKSRARYLADGSNAEYQGAPALLLAISNKSLVEALPFREAAEYLGEKRLNSWRAFPIDCCILTHDSKVTKRLSDDGSHLCYFSEKVGGGAKKAIDADREDVRRRLHKFFALSEVATLLHDGPLRFEETDDE